MYFKTYLLFIVEIFLLLDKSRALRDENLLIPYSGNLYDQLLNLKKIQNQTPKFLNKIHNVTFDFKYFLSNLNLDETRNGLNLTLNCVEQLSNFSQALLNNEEWAIQVFDSFGKPSSGILRGSINWLGDYKQCINKTSDSFTRKYCYISNTVVPVKYGICVPETCNYVDLYTIVYYLWSLLPLNEKGNLPLDQLPESENYIVCQEAQELDWGAILSICVVSLLVFYVLISTLYDLKVNSKIKSKNSSNVKTSPDIELKQEGQEEQIEKPIEKKSSRIHQLLIGSSIYTNSIKLFTVNESSDQLSCLNGIRFMSIAWVILGHTYSFSSMVMDNIAYIDDLRKQFFFMMILNGILAVDTFFLLSGLLTSYLFMKETIRTKITPKFMFKYYIHRYLRITPVHMIVLMISARLSKYLGDGPIYPSLTGVETEMCKSTWYINLLYLNNVWKRDKQCLGVSWYLSNDMQFHWIAPIVLLPLAFKKPKIGVTISILFIIANIITSALVINSEPGSEKGLFLYPYFYIFAYVVPWLRISPFMIGLLLGYILFKQKSKQNVKIRPAINIFFWLLSLLLMSLAIFGDYSNYGGNGLSKVVSLLYQSTSKILWSIGLAYIIYACLTGNGGFVNSILSWKLWVPLARVSFSLYLIHSLIMLYFMYSDERPLYVQHSQMAYRFIGNLFYSLIGAYVVNMFVELPFIALEKVLFK
ncbi:unnamed protein product [Brachionus calyciflorus]|uniref:Nose resistant-to-fluoxetine protein N-terminal domain-containing protein n=1 Tax=Brachionus calyciflorus TaxID=104777 RepID=A0A813VIB6_9BILA|nr:unnamed protein product [Brachionus calyciflorus]